MIIDRIFSRGGGAKIGEIENDKKLAEAATQVVIGQLAASTSKLKAAEATVSELQKQLTETVQATPVRSESIDAELINLLSQFQEKGRFVDFLMEDVSRYTDQQVAAAARVVHQGCGAVVREHFSITPAHSSREGEAITVESSDSAGGVRLVGNVGGQPPYKGVVLHRGWKTEKVTLPRVVQESLTPERIKLIAPAQVEVR